MWCERESLCKYLPTILIDYWRSQAQHINPFTNFDLSWFINVHGTLEQQKRKKKRNPHNSVPPFSHGFNQRTQRQTHITRHPSVHDMNDAQRFIPSLTSCRTQINIDTHIPLPFDFQWDSSTQQQAHAKPAKATKGEKERKRTKKNPPTAAARTLKRRKLSIRLARR